MQEIHFGWRTLLKSYYLENFWDGGGNENVEKLENRFTFLCRQCRTITWTRSPFNSDDFAAVAVVVAKASRWKGRIMERCESYYSTKRDIYQVRKTATASDSPLRAVVHLIRFYSMALLNNDSYQFVHGNLSLELEYSLFQYVTIVYYYNHIFLKLASVCNELCQ